MGGGDADEPPERLKDFARRFRVDESRGPADAVRFVNLMFRAFLPEIETLQDDKAAALASCRERDPGHDPFEDRNFEILSRIPIDVRALAIIGAEEK